MSDLWVNIRFGTRYLQIKPWSITFNRGMLKRSEFDKSWEVYQFFWYIG